MTTISTTEQAPVAKPLVGRPDVNRKRLARLGWTFSTPALIVVLAVTIFPIVYSVVMSFSNVQVTGNGFSLNGFTTANYQLVLKNSTWHNALGFTIIYTLITVLIELVIGTCVALVLERLTSGRGWIMALRLPDPPTAIFASQNLVTIGTVKALKGAGLQDRMALVGFDDFVLADVLVPGVTVITRDTMQLGRLAARLLFARLDGDDSPARTHVVPTGMVIQGSGEIRPAASMAVGG
jgi:ABC-type sulfate transport system permease subunit